MIFWRVVDNNVYPIKEVDKLGFEQSEGLRIPDDYLENQKFMVMRTAFGLGDWAIISAMPRLIKEKYPNTIKQIRGRGLLIGIQLYKDQTEFIKKLMDNQLLTIRAAENVVRILPPLNVKKNELDLALKIIEKVCSQIK